MMQGPRAVRASSEAGFTLVEMLVALALFALIGLASFAVLDTVIRTRDRTEGRLDAVAALDRALILWSRDLEQSDPGSQEVSEDVLTFSLDASGGPSVMRYVLEGDGLERIAGEQGAQVRQRLASGIASLGWRVLDRAGVWHEAWPPEIEEEALVGIEMRLTLTGGPDATPSSVRRLAELSLAPAE